MNSLTFSQGLSPQVQIIENDTLFCFTIGQSKTIARHLTNSAYCDSLEGEYVTNIKRLNEINKVKDTTIIQLQHKIINLNSIADNNSQSIEKLQDIVKIKDRKLRNSRFHKTLLIIGGGIAGGILLIK